MNYGDSYARASSYVFGRRCGNGGFCFYRNEYLEEPNLSDTWHALASLKLLGTALPESQDLDAWLGGIDSNRLHPEALHDWVFSRQMMHADWTPDQKTCRRISALELLPSQREGGISYSLAALLRIVRLKSCFSTLERPTDVIAWLGQRHHGGYGGKPNLQETALALELLAAFGTPDQTAETRAFVDSLQSPLLGFNNTPDSRYCRIDILLAGVRCCAQLDLPIRHAGTIRSTVLSAQREDGAFADVPGSLPTLETHYSALLLLDMLDHPYRQAGDRSPRPSGLRRDKP